MFVIINILHIIKLVTAIFTVLNVKIVHCLKIPSQVLDLEGTTKIYSPWD